MWWLIFAIVIIFMLRREYLLEQKEKVAKYGQTDSKIIKSIKYMRGENKPTWQELLKHSKN